MAEFNTKLNSKFAFWYRIADDTLLNQKHLNKDEYEDTVKIISEFDNIETFWKIFQHMKKPCDLKSGIEFQLFKDNIKPIWEDDNNKHGGKITIKIKKEYSSLVWEELVLGFIGANLTQKSKEEINGIVLSVKRDFNLIQIWFRTFTQGVIDELVQSLRTTLEIPESIDLDIRRFYTEQTKGFHSQIDKCTTRKSQIKELKFHI